MGALGSGRKNQVFPSPARLGNGPSPPPTTACGSLEWREDEDIAGPSGESEHCLKAGLPTGYVLVRSPAFRQNALTFTPFVAGSVAHHTPLSFPSLPSLPGSWGRSRKPHVALAAPMPSGVRVPPFGRSGFLAPLPTVHCLLPTAYCRLPTVHSPLDFPLRRAYLAGYGAITPAHQRCCARQEIEDRLSLRVGVG